MLPKYCPTYALDPAPSLQVNYEEALGRTDTEDEEGLTRLPSIDFKNLSRLLMEGDFEPLKRRMPAG